MPRPFLIGQLHIEHYCDTIITGYFSGESQKKSESLGKFIKSKFMSFNDKIELIKLLKNDNGELTVSKEIVNSLIVVAEIRYAFQHHLGREDSMKSLENNRRKIIVENKEIKLNEYSNANDLMNDFKKFFEWLYPKLIAVWIKTSFSEEEQKKFLDSVAKSRLEDKK